MSEIESLLLESLYKLIAAEAPEEWQVCDTSKGGKIAGQSRAVAGFSGALEAKLVVEVWPSVERRLAGDASVSVDCIVTGRGWKGVLPESVREALDWEAAVVQVPAVAHIRLTNVGREWRAAFATGRKDAGDLMDDAWCPPRVTILDIRAARPSEPTPNLAEEQTAEDGTPPVEKVRITWQDAAARMERLQRQGVAFTSQRRLAKDFGCSPRLIRKAIERNPALQAWAATVTAKAAPRAQGMTAKVLSNTPAVMRAPEDDAAIREYLERESLTADERARFNGLSDEDKISFLDNEHGIRKYLARDISQEERDFFNSLSLAEQVSFVNDPDAHELDEQVRILGRKP